MCTPQEMAARVRQLATARALAAKTKAQVEALENTLHASRKYVTLAAINEAAKARLEEAESAVRLAAEQGYREFGEQHPHEAVSVAVKRTVTPGEQAMTFAGTHVPKAIVLDAKVFNKAVLAFVDGGVDVPPDAATIADTPMVRVKTDLSEYLPA